MNPLLLGQSDLEAIIRNRIAERHGVSVELSTELVRFEQTEDHVVAHLRNTNGAEDKEETVQVPYLVGTDGGRSKRSLSTFAIIVFS